MIFVFSLLFNIHNFVGRSWPRSQKVLCKSMISVRFIYSMFSVVMGNDGNKIKLGRREIRQRRERREIRQRREIMEIWEDIENWS